MDDDRGVWDNGRMCIMVCSALNLRSGLHMIYDMI